MKWHLFSDRRVHWAGLLLLCTGSGLVVAQPGAPPPQGAPQATFQTQIPVPAQTPSPSAADFSKAFQEATQKVLPSVVSIRVLSRADDKSGSDEISGPSRTPDKERPQSSLDDWFYKRERGNLSKPNEGRESRNLPGFSREPRDRDDAQSLGSGIVIDVAGLVLTNFHVVDTDRTIMVRTADGREFRVDRVWSDSRSDLAVIHLVNAANLIAAELGDSDQLTIGQWVLALGQPFGLESSVTAGIVSATNRHVGLASRECYLQTDAAINPGNSGGPLVNLAGQVVGINTAISSRSGGNEGVGFAIPVNLARWVANQLIHDGQVRRSYLGVTVQALSGELAERLSAGSRRGVVVVEVSPNSPAARAGVEIGDVIAEVGGHAVESPAQLQLLVECSPSEHDQPLTVLRQNRQMTIKFRPATQPGDSTADRGRGSSDNSPSIDRFNRLGIAVSPRSQRGDEVESDYGVVITAVEPNSPASRAGIAAGMVVLQINHRKVDSMPTFSEVMSEIKPNEKVLLLVRTRDGARFVMLDTESVEHSEHR